MFRKAVNLVILVPLAIVLIVLSVANRQTVTMALNPFRPEDAVLSLQAPFFVFLFAAAMVGLLIGSAVTWLAQGRYRKRARILREQAMQWQKTPAPANAPAKPPAPGSAPARQIEA